MHNIIYFKALLITSNFKFKTSKVHKQIIMPVPFRRYRIQFIASKDSNKLAVSIKITFYLSRTK